LRRLALKLQPRSTFFFAISARASGEANDIFLVFTFASGSPTIFHTDLLLVPCSTRVTVAPNVIVSPDSFDVSMTSARESSPAQQFALRFGTGGLWRCDIPHFPKGLQACVSH
jgi:hypothetical protein